MAADRKMGPAPADADRWPIRSR